MQRETITLKRGGEKGLGFSIAGGRGSTAYKDGDPVNRLVLLFGFVDLSSLGETVLLPRKKFECDRAVSMSIVKPKPKVLLQSITTGETNAPIRTTQCTNQKSREVQVINIKHGKTRASKS